MNEQYIHKLTYTTKQADIYDQATGKWIVGADEVEITVICRAMPNNGSGRKKPNKDGVLTEYSFDLGFPIDTQDIPKNAYVKITGVRDELLFEGELLGYQVGVRSILGWI